MEIKEADSLTEILEALNDIQTQYSKEMMDEVNRPPLILYRGLSDSGWGLESTLDRQSSHTWTVRSYYKHIYYCAPQIESFLGTSWNLGTREDMEKDVKDCFQDLEARLPHYEYWAYLRHHGFPSPLLDWTKSPYIGLFFALCDHSRAESASLYVYIETPSILRVDSDRSAIYICREHSLLI